MFIKFLYYKLCRVKSCQPVPNLLTIPLHLKSKLRIGSKHVSDRLSFAVHKELCTVKNTRRGPEAQTRGTVIDLDDQRTQCYMSKPVKLPVTAILGSAKELVGIPVYIRE